MRKHLTEKPLNKGQQVQAMFDSIAPRYDLMNRLMTLGQDQKWRHFVVGKAAQGFMSKPGHALDLATGTGDIAALIKKTHPGVHVTGGDFSAGMLELAQKRFQQLDITWLKCDANQLPFPDGSFDAVTFGFLLRNVSDVHTVLNEVFRVLKPGGMVVCLDTTPPRKNLFYPLIRLHFALGIPLLGKLIARDPSAYSYLTQSTFDFIEAEQLEEHIRQAGFSDTGFRTFMFQTIAVHWGQKPS